MAGQAWRGAAGQGSARQGRQGEAGRGMARQGAAGLASPGMTRQGEEWQARHGEARHGPARQGMARQARQGMTWQGWVWQGRRGKAGRGWARPGMAGTEKASMKFETKTGKDYAPIGTPALLMRAIVEAGGEAQAIALERACSVTHIHSHLRPAVRNGAVIHLKRGRHFFFKLGGGMQGVRKVFTIFSGRYPRCTTAASYAIWRAAALHSQPLKHLGYCEDCSREYQTEMKLQERCENPTVWFIDGHAGIGPK